MKRLFGTHSHPYEVSHWHNVVFSRWPTRSFTDDNTRTWWQHHTGHRCSSHRDIQSQVLFGGESGELVMMTTHALHNWILLTNVVSVFLKPKLHIEQCWATSAVWFQWSSRIAPIPQSTVLHRLEYPPTLKWLLGAEARASFCPNLLGWVSKRGCGAAPLTGGPVRRFKQAHNI